MVILFFVQLAQVYILFSLNKKDASNIYLPVSFMPEDQQKQVLYQLRFLRILQSS